MAVSILQPEVNIGEEIEHSFELVREIRSQYRRFNTKRTQLTVKLQTPTITDANPVDQFIASVNDLFENALQDVGDGDMVGIAIHNASNQNRKPMGISFRGRDQLSVHAIWSEFEKVTQSNARFNALDTLTVAVKMPASFGNRGNKTMGPPISVMTHLKKSVIQIKSETNSLAHALIIAIAKVTNDPNYAAYRKGQKIYSKVDQLLAATGVSLDNGGGIPKLEGFQDHFRHYKIVVYTVLNCEEIMFEVSVESAERLNLLYDEVSRHYHVIGKVTAAMTRKYVCKACDKGCGSDVTHTCDQTCSCCIAVCSDRGSNQLRCLPQTLSESDLFRQP